MSSAESKDRGGGVGGLKRGKAKTELAAGEFKERDKGREPGGVPGNSKGHLRLVAMNFK